MSLVTWELGSRIHMQSPIPHYTCATVESTVISAPYKQGVSDSRFSSPHSPPSLRLHGYIYMIGQGQYKQVCESVCHEEFLDKQANGGYKK